MSLKRRAHAYSKYTVPVVNLLKTLQLHFKY